MKQINSVYLLGLGAVGGLYAAKLLDAGSATLKIIADAGRMATLHAEGLTVNERVYHFDCIAPGDASQPPADLIIIAVKSAQLQQAIASVKAFVGKDTVVMSLLNGISSEDLIGAEIGMEHLVYAYAVGMDSVREGRQIVYSNTGRIVFGEKHNEVLTDRVEAIKKLLEGAEIPHQIPADMQKAQWAKFMMNVGLNQGSAVLKAPYGMFQHNSDAHQLMLMAAKEVLILSQHAGINLEQSDVDNFVQIINTLNPTGKTSMLQDVDAQRKSEVDLFAGTVIQLGEKYGVPTPVNQTLYHTIKAMEAMYGA